ncbi:MAG: class I SAM-dependent methyltransferase [Actinomycetota bacterium]|nr:class I SAM-dependent methyltransferase [Actinomycetota bacterium]
MAGNEWDAQTYDRRFGFVGRYGDDVLDLLDARPGERVLDLGCGTGRHAAELASRGAIVVGLDADTRMLDKAAADHPRVTFVQADATAFGLAQLGSGRPFDACFSNAALHWMTPQDAVLRNVRSVLRDGGRFVAEMGGAGNIAALDGALRAALSELGLDDVDIVSNYFPTVGVQSLALEDAGFRVELATWFRRPTALGPDTTAADWTRHFRSAAWGSVPVHLHERLAAEVDDRARTAGLLTADGWFADYCRLRFVAVAR